MKAEPLSKEIYNKAKKEGVDKIILQFSGGNDEGYLDVQLIGEDSENLRYDENSRTLSREIEDWAWKVYHYSGAGDGSNYGDNITYDLVKGEVSTEEWYDAPQHQYYEPTKLELQ